MSLRMIDIINRGISNLVNKTSAVYEAFIGKEEYIPNSPIVESSDYNCGAIANEAELLRTFVNQLISYFDVEEAEGRYLEILTSFFLSIERIFDESDTNLRNRLIAYLQRKENPRWDTPWGLRDIFKYFFTAADVLFEENYIEDDMILNGGFEAYTPPNFDSWTKSESGSSTVTQETTIMFEELASAKFSIDSSNNTASLLQTKNSLAAGDCKIGFWYKDDGDCPDDNVVKISVQRSSDSHYYQWDDTWDSGVVYKEFPKSTDWALAYAYIKNLGTENLTFKIENAGTTGTAYIFYVDRCMFGTWKTYPSYKLLLLFTMEVGEYSNLWRGDDDNLIDRGECESATSPMIFDETVPVKVNATWAKDPAEQYFGDNSYKFTKAVGTATVDLVDSNATDDLHGLVAETEYTFIVRVKIPSAGGMLGSEVTIKIGDYIVAWDWTTQACALVYDAWQYVKLTRTIRSTATGAIIRIEVHSDATDTEYLYSDDIRVVEGVEGDIELASFIGQDFISGPGGGYTSDFYLDLLNKAKPAGVKTAIENIGRNV